MKAAQTAASTRSSASGAALARLAHPGESPPERFAGWLLRPFLDLGPPEAGPLYARGIDEYWRAFADARVPRFALQRTLPPAFRTQLVDEAGRPEFRVGDPRQLPRASRSARWREMCEALEQWSELSGERRWRLALLLHALCFYEPILSLVPAKHVRLADCSPDELELQYWRASASYVLGLRGPVAQYGTADLTVFDAIVAEAPDALPAGFNAAVKVFVHRAKTGAPLEELEAGAACAERALEDAVGRLGDFDRHLLTSRLYRALGFLPQRRGDQAEVVRVMDLAERHALAMQPTTPAQELLYLENLHPLMESRTKEALWLGDRELALSRSRKVVELDPYDAKAWVELGEVHTRCNDWAAAAEAYVVAGTLGPPASAIGRHMAGVCFRELGQDLLAAFFFKEALEVDSLGISPRLNIETLPDGAVTRALKEWSVHTLAP
jgi:tetratricopeptide (TPR) repeat protein